MNSKPPVCAASSPLTMPAASNTYDYVQLNDARRDSTPLAEEVALAIAYNGLNQAVMLVSPTHLEDFAVGFSVGSGIVASTDEIYDVKLSGSGSALYADLEISSRAFWNLKNQRRQLAGTSGCGLCGVEALEQALPELATLPGAPLPPAHWLAGLRQRIDAFQPLGQHCGAVHAALVGLVIEDGVVNHTAVIPDHHVTDRPAMAEAEVDLLAVSV